MNATVIRIEKPEPRWLFPVVCGATWAGALLFWVAVWLVGAAIWRGFHV